ncbi:MAG: WbqC family protein [Prevotellaceae bacterium]|jgi:hypothetical protein|nr:WbqC family protein [Prevotellaceae bacterium]
MEEVYLSAAYLPNIQYFTKLLAARKVYIEQHENYVKQSYRTRCDIYSANGVMQLNIPVERQRGEKIPIKDVRIDYKRNWQHVHWQSIVSAYRSSPFFEYYTGDLQPFYKREETFLFDFNVKLMEKMLELAGIKANISFTGEYIRQPAYPEFDYRLSISPKPRLQRTDSYFKMVDYYQIFRGKYGFMSNLSILDLLCNEGNNTVSILRDSL